MMMFFNDKILQSPLSSSAFTTFNDRFAACDAIDTEAAELKQQVRLNDDGKLLEEEEV